jgi:hypothetical protein
LYPQLNGAATAALHRLKKAFGGSNMISAVRNDFSFHHPKPDDLEAAFQAAVKNGMMEEQDWGIYFTRTLLPPSRSLSATPVPRSSKVRSGRLSALAAREHCRPSNCWLHHESTRRQQFRAGIPLHGRASRSVIMLTRIFQVPRIDDRCRIRPETSIEAFSSLRTVHSDEIEQIGGERKRAVLPDGFDAFSEYLGKRPAYR